DLGFGGVDGAVIEGFDAAEDLEESGFAGAVGADDADTFFGRDQPVQVFKQDAGAEAFPGSGKLDHWVFRGAKTDYSGRRKMPGLNGAEYHGWYGDWKYDDLVNDTFARGCRSVTDRLPPGRGLAKCARLSYCWIPLTMISSLARQDRSSRETGHRAQAGATGRAGLHGVIRNFASNICGLEPVLPVPADDDVCG